MNIDWSKAPEGATHYRPESDGKCALWLKKVDGEWDFTMTGRSFWRSLNREIEDFSVLVERPTAPTWNREGLPPVGTVCEYRKPKVNYRSEFVKVQVIAYGHERCFLRHWASQNEFLEDLSEVEFRSIRTPEQIAAEEREKAIEEIASLIGRGTFSQDAAAIYDAGYRKVEGGAA